MKLLFLALLLCLAFPVLATKRSQGAIADLKKLHHTPAQLTEQQRGLARATGLTTLRPWLVVARIGLLIGNGRPWRRSRLRTNGKERSAGGRATHFVVW